MFNNLANDSRSVIAAEYLFALYQRDASRKPVSSISESHDMPCKLKVLYGGKQIFQMSAKFSFESSNF